MKKLDSSFNYKIIYVFTIKDDIHKGLLKIGDTTIKDSISVDKLSPNSKKLKNAAWDRIKKYTNTAGVTVDLLHVELAVRECKKGNDIVLESFRDYDVHNVLKNSGISHKKVGNTTGKEWFDIDLDTAKKAIDAVKSNYKNLGNTPLKNNKQPIIFRPEQEECIKDVVKHFKNKKNNRYLINAKMRFGKTLVALEIIKRSKFQKTIIITNRPVVNAGWYEDFGKIFDSNDNYIYGSKANGYTLEDLNNMLSNFIYFASIQDLRGSSSVGGKFNKNDNVFSTDWDCLIIDEAHEGTTTALGEDTIDAIQEGNKKCKVLSLSGTPFNIITNYDDSEIYTWDYVMEQERKNTWDENNFFDPNPYEELPELEIYTYSLEKLINDNYVSFEDKAFNFREFFRTYTGDIKIDQQDMPATSRPGDFVHEDDINSFLNLMTKEDPESLYPYSTEEYRNIIKHSLWMVPGVREAKALKKLMLKHPIFGNGQFNIVNVAGDGDEEGDNALSIVKNAINKANRQNQYTITLSCGKLTTGVTVKNWNAVFMLAGSYSTSAASYLQTIFRVQSPCNYDGKIKSKAYVFDFAPDRTLKMVSQAVNLSSKAGKTTTNDRQNMGKFLNYCPVISINGSKMKQYDTSLLLQQLKRSYVDKVVTNGFDDTKLYNFNLLNLTEAELKQFEELKKILSSGKVDTNPNNVNLNHQGLTDEEHEEEEKLKEGKKLSEEDKERLAELRKKAKERRSALGILRSISIRIPMLIYGADIPYESDIKVDEFIKLVDDESWQEFMPEGITKEKFYELSKYYDEDIFIGAGKKIRDIVKQSDTLPPLERVQKIASLFSMFKNPDKETVLTPWRVVNMQLSNTLGGWCFFDEKFDKENQVRYVNQEDITDNVFCKEKPTILEINSKTGLYPLYAAYTIYKNKVSKINKDLKIAELNNIWNDVISNNIFSVCKTPMAKLITKRTLVGYSNVKINAHCFDDLINKMKNKPDSIIKQLGSGNFWKKDVNDMKFDAVIGNPPYQLKGGSGGKNDAPIYQYFADTAEKLNPNYVSLIIPTRWFSGGRENLLGKFRNRMLNNDSLRKMVTYTNSREVFPTVTIKGGVGYYLIDNSYHGDCEYTLIDNGIEVTEPRKLNELEILVRDPKISRIVKKVISKNNESYISDVISSDTPFGIGSNPRSSKKNPIDVYTDSSKNHNTLIYHIENQKRKIEFINGNLVTKNAEDINKIKVFVPEAAGSGTDSKIIGKPELAPSNSVCSQSFLYVPFESEAEGKNFIKYLKTKFFRALASGAKISQSMPKRSYRFVPLQDFTNNSDINWNNSIEEINEQLCSKYNLNSDDMNHIENKISKL